MIGLVLAGGGGKGFYQLGVYKALEELGLDKKISCYSGTSAGAMNAVMFADGGYEKAYEFWKRLVPDNAIDVDVEEYKEGIKALPEILSASNAEAKEFLAEASDEALELLRKTYHVFTRKHVKGVVDDMVTDTYSSTSDVFVTCGNVTSLKKEFRAPLAIWQYFVGKTKAGVEYINVRGVDRDYLTKVLLATSALPMVFEPVQIGDEFYADGGIYDNVPVEPVYQKGIKRIIVVRLNRTVEMDYSAFEQVDIIDILPSENPGSFFSGTLNLLDETIDQRVEDGYKDCMTMMHRIVTIDGKCMNLYEALAMETNATMSYDNQQCLDLSLSEKITTTIKGIVKD